MTPNRLLASAIIPALAELADQGVADTFEARRFLLAIALQESGLAHRRQVSAGGAEEGPASSFWQFEKGGGCRGVLTHTAVAPMMRRVCDDYNIESNSQALWEAIRYNDVVAATAARLLIYTLPKSLPKSPQQGWEQYLSAWRPGKPHPQTWAGHWATAEATATGVS